MGDKEETGQTMQREPLPFSRMLAWGVGGVGENLMANLILALALPIYSVALNVNPALIGLALGLPRLWDAITDPFMGNISDNTRTRWGRRRPYIFVGAVLTGIFFATLWMPSPEWSGRGLFLFFLVVSILYYTAYTVFVVPFSALGFELSMDYNERTKIQATRTFFSTLSGLMLPWAYRLSFRPEFGSNEVEGVRVVGVVFGGIMIVSCVLPAIFARESVHALAQPRIQLLKAFRYTLSNRPFFLVAGTVLFVIVGIFLIQPMGLYMGIFYLFEGDRESAATLQGWAGTVFAGMGLLSIPLITYLGTHLGKRRTIMAGQSLVIVSYLASWFLYTPAMPYLSLICLALLCPGTTSVWILASSMLADCTDFDELNTGLRREGMYGAVYALIFKGALAGSLAVAGVLLALTGIRPELEGAQSARSILMMRVMFAVVPATFTGLAMVCSYLYPITEERAREVRKEVDKRSPEEEHAVQEAAVEPRA